MVARIKSQSQMITQRSNQKSVLLLGAGYSARALIPKFIARGYKVFGTTRSESKANVLRALGTESILFDGGLSSNLLKAINISDIILSSIPPTIHGDPFLNGLDSALASLAKKASWVGYLSATSVYGDRKGQWVYEDELLMPLTQRGKNRMAAEIQWLETGLPIHVFRLAGIYGPDRSNFQRLRDGKARAVIKAGHVVNRIHVDDIVRAVLLSIDHPNPVSIYNLADGSPAPPQDVINFSADMLDIPRPPQLAHEGANISDMARSFYKETKRVSIERAQKELGWSPKYKNYRQGLMAILKMEKGTPDSVWLSGFIKVPKADLSRVKRALPTHIRLSNQEQDCTFFRIWQDEDEPLKFHVIESFKSQKAYNRHQARMKNSEWATVSSKASRHYDVIGLSP